jgi:hypothetical protein
MIDYESNVIFNDMTILNDLKLSYYYYCLI